MAVIDPSYVLCDHGYMRQGWCDECLARRTQTVLPHPWVLLYLALGLVFGLIVLYQLDPAILVDLAALLYLAIVVILGWIVVRRENVARASGWEAGEAAPRASRSRRPRT